MKTLKFESGLCSPILSGEKTTTWRLFDDKDLRVGDAIEFVNKESGSVFGTGKITHVKTRTLGSLDLEDLKSHAYDSMEEMYVTYKGYYGDNVGPDSELKIIEFKFKSLQ